MFDQMPEREPEGVQPPAGRVRWEAAETGPVTIAALAQQPLGRLSTAELLDVVAGWERQAAWLAAQQSRVIAAAAARIRSEAEAGYGNAETTENLVGQGTR